MKKETLVIQTPIDTNIDGYITQTWSNVATLKGVLLPYGQQLAVKDYGYDAPVKYRAFNMRKISDFLVVGNRIITKNEELYIVFIADYGKVQDILLDTEMLAGGKSG